MSYLFDNFLSHLSSLHYPDSYRLFPVKLVIMRSGDEEAERVSFKSLNDAFDFIDKTIIPEIDDEWRFHFEGDDNNMPFTINFTEFDNGIPVHLPLTLGFLFNETPSKLEEEKHLLH